MIKSNVIGNQEYVNVIPHVKNFGMLQIPLKGQSVSIGMELVRNSPRPSGAPGFSLLLGELLH